MGADAMKGQKPCGDGCAVPTATYSSVFSGYFHLYLVWLQMFNVKHKAPVTIRFLHSI